MTKSHNLGFPRIGKQRELKKAVEAYWRGEITQQQLQEIGVALRQEHWKIQTDAGLDFIPVGDFSWYDHVLDTSVLFGVVPERFGKTEGSVALDTYFRMARGSAPSGQSTRACEMTKWFDTNYHYIVPEFEEQQTFRIASEWLFEQVEQALQAGHNVKPVLLGPLSFLYLGKNIGSTFEKLSLLDRLLPVYIEVLQRLQQQGVEWVQIDEPILVFDLDSSWQRASKRAYKQLNVAGVKTILTTYFGGLGNNSDLTCQLSVDALHIDVTTDPEQLETVLSVLPRDKILSLGVVSGRNLMNPLII